ncbi:MAG: hypothetical protein U0528_07490 [Anaerolineae bacterium]
MRCPPAYYGIVSRCEQRGIASRVVPDIFQLNMSQVQIENLEGIPLLGKSEPRMTPTKHFIKRALDLIIITLGAPFILLLTGLVALAIKLDRRTGILSAEAAG